MLFVQDSFSHSSSLLMSPPRTTKVRPQPTTPSTIVNPKKSLDQYIHEYELLQTDIVKTQLEVVKKKKKNEKKNSL